MAETSAWLDVAKLIIIPVTFAVVGFLYKQGVDTKKELVSSINHLENDLNKWKLAVTEKYATKTELDNMERRILLSIEKVENKLDRVLNKIMDK